MKNMILCMIGMILWEQWYIVFDILKKSFLHILLYRGRAETSILNSTVDADFPESVILISLPLRDVPNIFVHTLSLSIASLASDYFTLRYLSIALRMYLLRGISPRLLSILCNNDMGKVIPSFSVLSGFFLIVLTILVDYI